MTVSALIPTYNRREKVMRAIDSVLEQTVPVDEIIVVDDGSTDGTADALRTRYGSRISLIVQKNAGVSAARNHGIREARGEWIAFLDSDDTWFPRKTELQKEAILTLGDGVGLCFTDCLYESDPSIGKTVFRLYDFAPASKVGILHDPAAYLLAERGPAWTQSLLIRRSLLLGDGEFDESLQVGEDADLLMRLSFRTKFGFVAQPLVKIDRSPNREGLSDIYEARDDRKYLNIERRLISWVKLLAGTKYEPLARRLLRNAYYDSAECKFHQRRLSPALQELRKLRRLTPGYFSIFSTLISRKLRKSFPSMARHSPAV